MTSLQTKHLSSMTGVTDIIISDGTDKQMNESMNFTKRSGSVETCEESVSSDDDTDYDNESFDSDDDEDDDDYSLNSDIDEEELHQEKTPCQTTVAEKKSGLFLSLEMVKMLRISTSCENFNKLVEDETIQKMIPPTRSSSTVDVQKHESKMVFAIQTETSTGSHHNNKNKNDKAVVLKPKDMLFQLLSENNISIETKSYETIKDTFVIGDVSGYSLELMKAVKQGNVDYLRSLIGTQKTFQCANKFGESIVHATARHGHLQVLQFLLEELNVSMCVVCDTGRNPLHDSCWTAKPNFECIEYMINQYPEYLLITDKRGYTPLEYAPIDSHKAWGQFLNEKKDILIQLLKEKDGYPLLI